MSKFLKVEITRSESTEAEATQYEVYKVKMA